VIGYAEVSAEPNLFKKIHAITESTESAQEFPSVLSTHESEAVPDASLYQGTTLVLPQTPYYQSHFLFRARLYRLRRKHAVLKGHGFSRAVRAVESMGV
jgi:hypothetical protein